MSAFEIVKDYSKSINGFFISHIVSCELKIFHDEIQAKRKITRLLFSKAAQLPVISPCNLLKAYNKPDDKKRRKRLFPRAVLQNDVRSGVVTTSISFGESMHVAAEGICAAICQDEFAQHVNK